MFIEVDFEGVYIKSGRPGVLSSTVLTMRWGKTNGIELKGRDRPEAYCRHEYFTRGRKGFEVIEKVCGLLKFKDFESEGGLVKLAATLQINSTSPVRWELIPRQFRTPHTKPVPPSNPRRQHHRGKMRGWIRLFGKVNSKTFLRRRRECKEPKIFHDMYVWNVSFPWEISSQVPS